MSNRAQQTNFLTARWGGLKDLLVEQGIDKSEISIKDEKLIITTDNPIANFYKRKGIEKKQNEGDSEKAYTYTIKQEALCFLISWALNKKIATAKNKVALDIQKYGGRQADNPDATKLKLAIATNCQSLLNVIEEHVETKTTIDTAAWAIGANDYYKKVSKLIEVNTNLSKSPFDGEVIKQYCDQHSAVKQIASDSNDQQGQKLLLVYTHGMLLCYAASLLFTGAALATMLISTGGAAALIIPLIILTAIVLECSVGTLAFAALSWTHHSEMKKGDYKADNYSFKFWCENEKNVDILDDDNNIELMSPPSTLQ